MIYDRITVIGGGNIGTQFACMCASRGAKVTVYTSRPGDFSETIEIIDEEDRITEGRIAEATADIGKALDGAQLVIITYPAFKLKEAADKMEPFVKPGLELLMVPGTGGAEYAFQKLLDKGVILNGLTRVPTVARLERYGKRVRCEGLRDELFIASVPSGNAKKAARFMEELWGIPCTVLPNYLSVTLTPSNPILHTTRLRTLFEDYEEGKVYDRNPLFYGEWSEESSKLLLACDEQLQNICAEIDEMDLTQVRSLKIHYESPDAPSLTRKLRSIRSLHNLKSPMKEEGGGWTPDFDSRYFTADFPYGLAIIEELADITGVAAPDIRETMSWYRNVTGNTERLSLPDYGIRTKEDIYKFYTER